LHDIAAFIHSLPRKRQEALKDFPSPSYAIAENDLCAIDPPSPIFTNADLSSTIDSLESSQAEIFSYVKNALDNNTPEIILIDAPAGYGTLYKVHLFSKYNTQNFFS